MNARKYPEGLKGEKVVYTQKTERKSKRNNNVKNLLIRKIFPYISQRKI